MTTRTAARRAAPLPPDERRTAIVHAVTPLLVERGGGITTREIAQAAGVSEGTLFKVFVDKDALIRAVVDAAIDQEPFELAIAAIDTGQPFRAQLTDATTLIQRRVVGIWKLLSRLDHDRHLEPKHRALPDSPALATLIAAADDALTEPPADAARLLRALTLSLTHPMLTSEPRSADAIVDLFLNGVGA